jgi:hypothetical protein
MDAVTLNNLLPPTAVGVHAGWLSAPNVNILLRYDVWDTWESRFMISSKNRFYYGSLCLKIGVTEQFDGCLARRLLIPPERRFVEHTSSTWYKPSAGELEVTPVNGIGTSTRWQTETIPVVLCRGTARNTTQEVVWVTAPVVLYRMRACNTTQPVVSVTAPVVLYRMRACNTTQPVVSVTAPVVLYRMRACNTTQPVVLLHRWCCTEWEPVTQHSQLWVLLHRWCCTEWKPVTQLSRLWVLLHRWCCTEWRACNTTQPVVIVTAPQDWFFCRCEK